MEEKTNKYEGLKEQVELMTSLSSDDWDINQHYCWKVECSRCKLGKPNVDGSTHTYGECREYARNKALELAENGTPDEKPKYEKFFLIAIKEGENGIRVPWTGVDQTLNHAKELLMDGWSVQVIPYTRKTWNSEWRETCAN